MILVLKSWFHVEDAIYHTKNWKVYVAKQKNIGVSDMFTVKTITVLHYIVHIYQIITISFCQRP